MFVQKLFKRDAEGATQSAVLDLRVVPKKTSWLPFQLTLHRLLVGWYHMLMVMFQEIWQSKSILHDNKNKTDHNNSSGGWSIWSQQLSKENQKSEGVLKFYDTSSHLYISIYRFTYIHLYQIKCTYDCVCMYAQESIISLQQSYFFLVLSGVHFQNCLPLSCLTHLTHRSLAVKCTKPTRLPRHIAIAHRGNGRHGPPQRSLKGDANGDTKTRGPNKAPHPNWAITLGNFLESPYWRLFYKQI